MSVSKSHRKIGVFSHGGTSNLGDEALVAAVIQNVRRRIPDAEIIGFSMNPEDTRLRHHIPCFPIRRLTPPAQAAPPAMDSSVAKSVQTSPRLTPLAKIKETVKTIPGLSQLLYGLRNLTRAALNVVSEARFLLASYRRLKGVDLLLVAGSQQLNDIYGPWGFPYTLYKWTTLAKINSTKVALLSVGAGPIKSPFSQFLIRRVLNAADYRSYRDSISSHLVESIGVKGLHPVFPDLVYSLQLPAPKPVTDNARAVVGTNPVPFFDGRYWRTPDPARYQEYVHKIVNFAEWLEKTGHSILFFPTQFRADVRTISDILQSMNGLSHSPNILSRSDIHSLEDLITEISRADLVVANRYHGILLSLMMNKPVLGIAYHEKSRALLAQVGQGDYVVNVADFKLEEIIERFSALEANAPAIKKQIAEHMAPLRRALERQYDQVFSLIGVNPAEAG